MTADNLRALRSNRDLLEFSLLYRLVPPYSYTLLEIALNSQQHTAISKRSYDRIACNSLPNLGHQMRVLPDNLWALKSLIAIYLNSHYFACLCHHKLYMVRKILKFSTKYCNFISKQSYDRNTRNTLTNLGHQIRSNMTAVNLRAHNSSRRDLLEFSLVYRLVPPYSYIRLERALNSQQNTAISKQSYDWIARNSLPNLGRLMRPVLWQMIICEPIILLVGIFLNLHYYTGLCHHISTYRYKDLEILYKILQFQGDRMTGLRAIVFQTSVINACIMRAVNLRAHNSSRRDLLKFSLLYTLVPPYSYTWLERSWNSLQITAISKQSYDWITRNTPPNMGHLMRVLG